MKNSVLALAVIGALLSGCGGSNSGGSDDVPVETEKQVSVIDGYLSGVDVFVDRDADGVASDAEFIGVTDSLGQVTLSLDDEAYGLIANVKAGYSSDADFVGAVSSSIELTASSGSGVISPFTTLASNPLLNFDVISSVLGVRSDLLKGDYIAQKEVSNDAIKVHALARSLMGVMQSSRDPEVIFRFIDIVIPYMDQFINENGYGALNDVTFLFRGGVIEVENNYPDLESYFASIDRWNHVSLNGANFRAEGVQYLEFDMGTRTLDFFDMDGEFKFTQDYLFDGLRFVAGGGVNDSVVAITRDVAVSRVGEGGELAVWTKKNIAFPFQSALFAGSEFSGKTWYMISDDSPTVVSDVISASFVFSELDGSPQGQVSVVEGSKSLIGSYYVTTELDPLMGIISPLYIQLPDAGEPMRLLQVAGSHGLRVFYEMNRGIYYLLTDEAGLAESILAK